MNQTKEVRLQRIYMECKITPDEMMERANDRRGWSESFDKWKEPVNGVNDDDER